MVNLSPLDDPIEIPYQKFALKNRKAIFKSFRKDGLTNKDVDDLFKKLIAPIPVRFFAAFEYQCFEGLSQTQLAKNGVPSEADVEGFFESLSGFFQPLFDACKDEYLQKKFLLLYFLWRCEVRLDSLEEYITDPYYFQALQGRVIVQPPRTFLRDYLMAQEEIEINLPFWIDENGELIV